MQIEPSQIKLLTKCKLCESDGKNVNRVEDLDTSKPHNLYFFMMSYHGLLIWDPKNLLKLPADFQYHL